MGEQHANGSRVSRHRLVADATVGVIATRCRAVTSRLSGSAAKSSSWPASCWPGFKCFPLSGAAIRYEPERLRLRIFAVECLARSGRCLGLRLAYFGVKGALASGNTE